MAENRKIQKVSTSEILFNDYCGSSSIHGVQFFVKEGFRFGERLFWMLLVYVSVVGMIYMQNLVIQKWYRTPVLVTLSNKLKPVYEVPFPTVTICPLVKAHNDTITPEQREILSHIMRDETIVEGFNVGPFEKTMDHFRNLNPYNSIRFVSWKRDITTVIDHVTDDGLCYSFNKLSDTDFYQQGVIMLSGDEEQDKELDWTLESGYKPETDADTYPKRLLYGNNRHALKIGLSPQKNNPNSIQNGLGFKISLTVPGNAILTHQNYIDVPPNHKISIALKPVLITADDNIRSYSNEHRYCYFNNEKYLRLFKHYSQENCEYECLVNTTIETCGCTKITMPKLKSCAIECNATRIGCYEDVLRDFYNSGDTCNCYPGCFALAYDTSITQSKISGLDYDQSLVTVYFASNEYQFSVRTELYGLTDLIANIGGIMGLFLGISGVSFIEIIYFVTNRFFVNCHQKNNVPDHL